MTYSDDAQTAQTTARMMKQWLLTGYLVIFFKLNFVFETLK